MVAPESAKLTVPVGALPVTVAVNVTVSLTAEGFGALASVVVEIVWLPPADTCTVSALAVAEMTLMLMPYVASVNDCPASSAASVNVDVSGVMSSNSVSLLKLSQPEQIVSNGLATRICAPLFG